MEVLYSFRESKSFIQKADKFLDADEIAKSQWQLIEKPDFGKLIVGSGGLRKLRFAIRGRGKSGGVRIIYYWADASGYIFLLDIYAKNEKADLSVNEIKFLRKVVEEWLR